MKSGWQPATGYASWARHCTGACRSGVWLSQTALHVLQGSLLDELVEGDEGDLAAIEAELAQLTVVNTPAQSKKQPKRAPLPPELPRTLIHHKPENIQRNCGCQLKRVGEDVSEKLDYVPGEFTVERHIRGKWACAQCETLIQAPVPGTCSSH